MIVEAQPKHEARTLGIVEFGVPLMPPDHKEHYNVVGSAQEQSYQHPFNDVSMKPRIEFWAASGHSRPLLFQLGRNSFQLICLARDRLAESIH